MFCVMWGVRNGEMVPRKWLMYSDSVDSLFCFCCKLFNNSTLDHISQKIRDEQVAYWRNVLPGPPLKVCKVCGCTLGFFREAALVSIFKLFFLLNENFSSFWVMYLDF